MMCGQDDCLAGGWRRLVRGAAGQADAGQARPPGGPRSPCGRLDRTAHRDQHDGDDGNKENQYSMEGLATEPVHHPSRDWNLEVTAYCVLCRSSCVLCLCDTLPHGLGWVYRHVGEITCEYCSTGLGVGPLPNITPDPPTESTHTTLI